MKLFLSSTGVARPDVLREVMEISPTEVATVALINNAVDPYPTETAQVWRQDTFEMFRLLGFQPILIDLREYEGKSKELFEKLRICKLIWVCGGNAFWLRYVMKTSGFDVIVKDLLTEGIVYGGWSAGSVVVGPSLRLIALMDDVKRAPEIVWSGLNLIDICIWPHWGKEKYLHLQPSATDRMQAIPHESLTLEDGEVLVVENGEMRLIR